MNTKHIMGEALEGLYLKGLLSNTGQSPAHCHSHLQVTCLVAFALVNGIWDSNVPETVTPVDSEKTQNWKNP